MYCGNCGTKIPDGSQFCPECGAPVVNRPSQERPVRQSSQRNARPVSRPKKKGKKGVIGVIIAAVAAAVLAVGIIVNPLGLGDMSKKFQKTSTEMTNDWNGAIGVYGSANSDTLNSMFASYGLGESWNASDWTKYQVTNIDYNVAAKDEDTYAVFLLFKCKDSSSSNLLLNDLLSDADDFKFEKTGKGWSYREDGLTYQANAKKKYVMICVYSDALASRSEKFIDKVGF